MATWEARRDPRRLDRSRGVTAELAVLALTALLQVGQIMLAGWGMNRDAGVAYNVRPRDAPAAYSPLTGRLRRAVDNHFEAMALFTIAVVVVTLSGAAGELTAACAWVLYVPAFAFGWSPWRSAIYAVGALATVLMLLVALI
jgi:uncharacterized MAPEG superfamily protein